MTDMGNSHNARRNSVHDQNPEKGFRYVIQDFPGVQTIEQTYRPNGEQKILVFSSETAVTKTVSNGHQYRISGKPLTCLMTTAQKSSK